MKKRIFLGISKKSYSLIIRDDLTKQSIKRNRTLNEAENKHYIILVALFDVLKEIEPNQEAIFYPNDDLIFFEWETEWKKNKEFSNKTKDIDIWKNIIKIIENKNINLTIKNTDNVLSALGKIKKEI